MKHGRLIVRSIWASCLLIGWVAATSAPAQTVVIVGTPHLTGLDVAPSSEQTSHTVEALSAFRPTQVCVERMSGERIEMMLADPADLGETFRRPELSSRKLASTIIPMGTNMQVRLGLHAGDARQQANHLQVEWGELDTSHRLQLIALQLAGFEFHSAALNWSYLEQVERAEAQSVIPQEAIEELDAALSSRHEVYALAVPLARKAGLHALCTADALEDETSGMAAAIEHGGQKILEHPVLLAGIEELMQVQEAEWEPNGGAAALTSMLRFHNSNAFAELDRRLQWDGLIAYDNNAGAFRRRLMYWHARTSEISAELFRALARGPDERVLLIIGSAHRSFTEASLRSQPWIEVRPALALLEPQVRPDDK